MKTKQINYYLRSTENQHQDETLPPQVQISKSNEQHYQSTLEIAPSDSEEQHPQSTTEAPASESEDQEIETLDEEQIPKDHITQSSTDHQPLEHQIRNRIMPHKRDHSKIKRGSNTTLDVNPSPKHPRPRHLGTNPASPSATPLRPSATPPSPSANQTSPSATPPSSTNPVNPSNGWYHPHLGPSSNGFNR
ncbi:putative protein TPRXL [Crassostrea angulata]|uniref:putative protein TPRXL n=1 Tax=Magallana angulata TaxID=2784310 RepID=UPI0022B0861F|nr:putative protein TPRXL [Crassostrea angulata]